MSLKNTNVINFSNRKTTNLFHLLVVITKKKMSCCKLWMCSFQKVANKLLVEILKTTLMVYPKLFLQTLNIYNTVVLNSVKYFKLKGVWESRSHITDKNMISEIKVVIKSHYSSKTTK